MTDKPQTISVAIALDGGRIKKAYASKSDAVIIEIYNSLLDKYEQVGIATCEIVAKAPRLRKSRTVL